MRKQLRWQVRQHAGINTKLKNDDLLSLLSHQIETLDKQIETLLVGDQEL